MAFKNRFMEKVNEVAVGLGADSPGTVRRAECRTHGYEIVVLLQETTDSR